MSKKSFLAVFGLLLALAFVNPPKAHAGVAIGVTIGGPGYARPVYPYYGYGRPVPCPPAYFYSRPYEYPAPVVYGGYYRRPYWRAERFERREHFDRREHFEHHDRFDRDRR
jgi:hypothetical protein